MANLSKQVDMIKRTCGMPECGKPHRAKGLCSTHYNQQQTTPEQRHPKQTIPCTWCKQPCIKDVGRERRYKVFCSLECRDHWRKATGTNPAPSPEARAAWIAACRAERAVRARRAKHARARARIAVAGSGTQGKQWVSGPCSRCGVPFVAVANSNPSAAPRYCSEVCGLRAGYSRRRAREASAEVENYSRFQIFVRDGWRCHLCRRLVSRTAAVPHPLAATIDHLVPLARGGADTAANVATAHFKCNCSKGDRVGGHGDQLAIIG